MKAVKIFAIVLLIFILVGILVVKFGSDKETHNTHSTTEFVSASEFDEVESEKIKKIQFLSENLQNAFPSEIFGGLYLNDEQNLVVNVTDLSDASVLKVKSNADYDEVIFRHVKYSLEYLETVKSKLIPFMAEYNIATIDANEVTNKIDIELYKENNEVEILVSEYIDSEDVTITVLPDDIEFILT